MKKSTMVRSLILSGLSMLLCLSMFVGSTFAWFTDSVESGKNTIMAGNLDVELDYWKDGSWVSVEGKTDLFDPNALWEPGHAEVVYLKLSNQGNLELKYQFLVSIFNEIEGMTKNGEAIRLSEHLMYGLVKIDDINTDQFKSREDAIAAVTDPAELANYNTAGTLAAKSDDASVEDEKLCALVVWMPTTVGNEANHDGIHVPTIELGVSLVATQTEAEFDSFGKDYDADSKYDDLPVASLTELAVMPVIKAGNLFNGTLKEDKALDTAYVFKTTESVDDAQQSEYGKWHADFVVSFDKAVASGTVLLAGQYDTFSTEWLAFTNEGVALAAGEQIRLLDSVGIAMNYEELCDLVKRFSCGAANLAAENVGTTMTVELRIYETKEPSASNGNSTNVETGKSIVIGKYSYKFEETADLESEFVKLEYGRLVDQEMTIIDMANNNNLLTATYSLDTYSFVAKQTATEVETSPYKDWLCDFFVSVDRPVNAGLALVGQYDSFSPDWYGALAPANANGETYENIGLLGLFSSGGVSNWTYEDIVKNVNTFNCGIIDTQGNNSGAVVTVVLRMTNPEDATVTIDAATITVVLP